jgi:hypothetical protein
MTRGQILDNVELCLKIDDYKAEKESWKGPNLKKVFQNAPKS